MDVNESWITDKDRFAFRWQSGPDRLRFPRIAADPEGPVSWWEALDAAAEGLAAAKDKGVGVITGGRLTIEDAYAYSKFARLVLGTNDIDFRTRPASAEEDAFLAAHVAGSDLGVTYGDLEEAGHVLTVGLEAEDEIGTVFLRLRKGVLANTTSVSVISAYETLGTSKMKARFIPATPGTEAEVLNAITDGGEDAFGEVFTDLSKDGAVILVGERAADTPGALTAARRLAERTGARLAWIPRRAGDRAAVDAGAMPTLLPGGRQVADSGARIDTAAVWGASGLPETAGRCTQEILEAAKNGELGAIVLGGVELADLPAGAQDALRNVFVVQLEVRDTETTALADVVLPVAPTSEKGGTFINWEGRLRPFGQTLVSKNLPDRRVLHDLAHEMGVDLGLGTLAEAVEEMAELRRWDGARGQFVDVEASPAPAVGPGQAVLASWKQMIDAGALLSHEPHLAKTARKPVAVMSAKTADDAGITGAVTVSGPLGAITLDVVTLNMPDGVVWVPQNSFGCQIHTIGSRAGDVVGISTEVAQ